MRRGGSGGRAEAHIQQTESSGLKVETLEGHSSELGLYLETVCHLLTSPQSLFVLWLETLSERAILTNTHSWVTMKSEVSREMWAPGIVFKNSDKEG